MNDIAVDPFDENRVVVVTSFGNVYHSTNGGSSWTNINSGLPSGAVTSAVLDRSAKKGIYVSLDGAVYFTNNDLAGWEPFFTNLPNVDTEEIELFYGGAGESRVRVGTYGRGLWESPMFDDAQDGSGGTLSCSSTISSFPYNESFESGLGDWSQGTGDDIDWTRRSGTTPSSGTGPSGAVDGTFYMYVETSVPNYPSKTAHLESVCFDLNAVSNPSLDFQYHMLGSSVGTLNLEVTTDGTVWSSIWSRSATQGSSWNAASVDLSAYATSIVAFRFNATSGSSWQGDICIDQLSIQAGPVAPMASECLNLELSFDNYPQETSWEISQNGKVILEGSSYATIAPGRTLTEEICVPKGCFDFTMKDSYGDGICCDKGNGRFSIYSPEEDLIVQGGEFTSSQTFRICADQVTELVNIEKVTTAEEQILVFPNPASTILHIQLPSKGNTVIISLIDLTGKEVLRQEFNSSEGLNLFKLDVSDLPKGSYILDLNRGSLNAKQRIVLQ